MWLLKDHFLVTKKINLNVLWGHNWGTMDITWDILWCYFGTTWGCFRISLGVTSGPVWGTKGSLLGDFMGSIGIAGKSQNAFWELDL